MGYEQARNGEFHIISSPAIVSGTFDTGANTLLAMFANQIPGITDFGYDHENDVQRRGKGQWGKNKPTGITDEYGGIKGNFDVEAHEGEKAVLAAIHKKTVAAYVSGRYNRLQEFFILANIETDDGAPMKCHFCWNCKVDGVPKKVSGDAKRFSFQGIIATDFEEKRGKYMTKDGNATPVTSIAIPTGDTAITWTDDQDQARFTLLVLVYRTATASVKEYVEVAATPAAGQYTATGSTITLNASDGLAANDKALVVYLVNA
jgi:hypothetical protein